MLLLSFAARLWELIAWIQRMKRGGRVERVLIPLSVQECFGEISVFLKGCLEVGLYSYGTSIKEMLELNRESHNSEAVSYLTSCGIEVRTNCVSSELLFLGGKVTKLSSTGDHGMCRTWVYSY